MIYHEVIPISLLNFTPERLTKIKAEIAVDHELRLFMQMIIDGWPCQTTSKTVLQRSDFFFNFRESLALENGVIFTGRQVIIPEPSMQEILNQLHTSHQDIKKTQLLAKESV